MPRFQAKRAVAKLMAADESQMDEAHKQRYYVYAAQVGAIALATSSKATKRIEGQTSSRPLDVGDTLKLFSG